MTLSDGLVTFLRDAVNGLGDFAPGYVTPLRAFLSMHDRPIEIQSVIDRGFTPDIANAKLEEILAEDSFLARCCGDNWHLAHALDLLFFSRLPDSSYLGLVPPLGFADSPFDQALEHLDRSLYQEGEFTKTAYFHLFNCAANKPHDYPEAPYPGWGFVELEYRSIPQILGENSWSSFLSPPHTGTIFLAVHDVEGFNRETLKEWLERRWKDIAPYRQVLQYSRDAIIDIDYVAPYFNPSWVNQIHREGLFYWGTPRQDKPPSNLWYYLNPWDSQEINAHWRGYQRYTSKFNSHTSSLRKAIRTAGDFFEESHKKTSRVEQFANLMIALEALYTPSDQTELTFRISQSCAVFIEGDAVSRENTFKFLRSMFKRRGKLFHGQYDVQTEAPQDFINDEELKTLVSIVRRSMVKFIALFLRGSETLEQVRKDLERAILDESFRDDFLQKADIDSLLTGESS